MTLSECVTRILCIDFNELYLNNGDNTFSDISESSGILNTRFNVTGSHPFDNIATITWATTMVDINMDGWIDTVLYIMMIH